MLIRWECRIPGNRVSTEAAVGHLLKPTLYGLSTS